MFSNHNLIGIKKYSVHVEDSEDNLQKRLAFKNLFRSGKQLNDNRLMQVKNTKKLSLTCTLSTIFMCLASINEGESTSQYLLRCHFFDACGLHLWAI